MLDMIPVHEAEAVRSPRVSLVTELAPVVTKGKFFFVDGEKFFLKGVTMAPSRQPRTARHSLSGR